MRPFVQHYDLIYSDKDYRKETEFLRTLVPHAVRPSILEIGSGTGNQTLLLSAWADVTAVETDKDFIEILRSKCAGHVPITVVGDDIAAAPAALHDAAAAYFHVVNYIHKDADLLHLLCGIAERLKQGAVFLFDMWHCETVLQDPPADTTRIKPTAQGKVAQRIMPELDTAHRKVTLKYAISIEPTGAPPLPPFEETIRLHLWTMDEIVTSLQAAGFRDIEFRDGRDPHLAAHPQSWTIWGIARKT